MKLVVYTILAILWVISLVWCDILYQNDSVTKRDSQEATLTLWKLSYDPYELAHIVHIHKEDEKTTTSLDSHAIWVWVIVWVHHILTNQHILEEADMWPLIFLPNWKQVTIRNIRTHPSEDLALLTTTTNFTHFHQLWSLHLSNEQILWYTYLWEILYTWYLSVVWEDVIGDWKGTPWDSGSPVFVDDWWLIGLNTLASPTRQQTIITPITNELLEWIEQTNWQRW